MYAVVVRVNIDPNHIEEALALPAAVIIPMLESQAGFAGCYFTRSDDGTNGLSISLFDTKENAEASAASATPPPGAPVTMDSVEVREVVASA